MGPPSGVHQHRCLCSGAIHTALWPVQSSTASTTATSLAIRGSPDHRLSTTDHPPTARPTTRSVRPVQFFVTAQQLQVTHPGRRRKSADNRERRTLAQGLVRTRLPTRAALCTVTTTAGARFRAGHRPPTRHRRVDARPSSTGGRTARTFLAFQAVLDIATPCGQDVRCKRLARRASRSAPRTNPVANALDNSSIVNNKLPLTRSYWQPQRDSNPCRHLERVVS